MQIAVYSDEICSIRDKKEQSAWSMA